MYKRQTYTLGTVTELEPDTAVVEDQAVAEATVNGDGEGGVEPEPDRPDDEVRDEITGQKRLFDE